MRTGRLVWAQRQRDDANPLPYFDGIRGIVCMQSRCLVFWWSLARQARHLLLNDAQHIMAFVDLVSVVVLRVPLQTKQHMPLPFRQLVIGAMFRPFGDFPTIHAAIPPPSISIITGGSYVFAAERPESEQQQRRRITRRIDQKRVRRHEVERERSELSGREQRQGVASDEFVHAALE